MTSGNSSGWSCRVAMRGGALILGLAAVMALGTGASVSAQGRRHPRCLTASTPARQHRTPASSLIACML
jgi:hypothetical protein